MDPYAAQWLRNLISAGHIAPGIVDERDIRDLTPADLAGFTQCHFFAGIGVWSLALRRAGWRDDWPVWTGSCPCQPFSAAGLRAGFDDERHLWPAWFHLITLCRPPILFGEQVANALGWLDLVSADLENEGYAFGAADLCAAGFGGAHVRQRLYFFGVGHAIVPGLEGHAGNGHGGHQPGRDDAHAAGPTRATGDADWRPGRDGKWRPVEPGTFPMASKAPARVGRLRAFGNALDAATAENFIRAVMA